jgi:hypothetical protein
VVCHQNISIIGGLSKYYDWILRNLMINVTSYSGFGENPSSFGAKLPCSQLKSVTPGEKNPAPPIWDG